MIVTLTQLREAKKDHFIARGGEGRELVMEPYCWCGRALDEEYFCDACDHECSVTFIVCADPRALAIAEELVRGNVEFRRFEVASLAE